MRLSLSADVVLRMSMHFSMRTLNTRELILMPAFRTDATPRWLLVLVGVLLVAGGYYILRGLTNFIDSGGTGVLATPTNFAVIDLTHSNSGAINTLDFQDSSPVTGKAARICQDYKVKVVRARIRQCPSESCETIDFPAQGTI